MTADSEPSGFPPGYFIIRSMACDRLLDVAMDGIEDGTEIILWPEKEKSLVESFRDPNNNNQVFFIDTSGALCSRSSGHAIDVEEDQLALRHRRPVSYPFPNQYAHNLPKFRYSAKTGEITVHFECDPAYPSPGAPNSDAWKNKTYLLTSLPLRKPRTIIDDASEFLASAILTPIAFLGGTKPPQARPEEVFNGDIDLNENDVVEEERGEEGEVDDSSELGRKVMVFGVVDKEKSDKMLHEKAMNRRRWQISPLRTMNARTGAS